MGKIISNMFYFIKPIYRLLKYNFLLLAWSKNSSKKTFGWNWKETNFNRIAVVNLILSKYSNPTYLEIGCASNSLFDSVIAINKTGVDPKNGGNKRITSDQFFTKNKDKFHCIFIDGQHTYEQVRKDLLNSINALKKGGYICLHDMLPRNWIEQHVPNISPDAWTGDVWKVAFELAKTSGIEFKILKLDHGVGVVKVLNKNVKLQDMRKELTTRQFDHYYENINSLPIIDLEEAIIWLKYK